MARPASATRAGASSPMAGQHASGRIYLLVSRVESWAFEALLLGLAASKLGTCVVVCLAGW